MSDEWTFSSSFEYANEEDAQWQFHDKPGQTHRQDLTGWEANNRSGVKGRLLEVVHGYKANDESRPRTLIVFEWLLIPAGRKDRIKDVVITVAFKAIGHRDGVGPGESLDDFDPVPIKWAPGLPICSGFSKATVTETANTDAGVQAGYNGLSLSVNRGVGTSTTVERMDHRLITGSNSYVDKNDGISNAMQWRFSENAQLKSGVQYVVRTAVLLRRRKFDDGNFNVVVVAEANGSSTSRMLRTVRRFLGIPSKDGPAAFDPKVLPGSSDGEAGEDDMAARKTERDWRNLDNLKLEDVLLKDWGRESVEESSKNSS
ncbi:hypothetical protein COL154_005126 [Colletotrichum chrysophilum]|uniref:Uncharacterized protein n=1 Tax=Colletotrichum chrysophilum TaxID=1836956 RepID=A0AAD9ECC6_9PEZI|nr:uncharacterized protein COL26b_001945 [Colletotrichum chrysophilum]KAJ0349052.1 hypothetical protein KNSL1_005099 [Colletotrichum chrysophilum]KAJ0364135.1 hypothetical protein COL154_005126 [Colletotrichum chrysophilum]KAJ0379794.1 hypothetical protein COL26b_001945 [Colletotrichum chrysophilum]KAK1843360.1 hypothetical protein CCHR01_14017 [Colletotrichum chrysophilum]